MAQKVETVEIPFCPCFEFFNDYGGKKRGTCSLQKIPRDDNYTLGSCQHEGDAESCLSGGEPEIADRLRIMLEEHVKKLTIGKNYFEHLLNRY